MALPIKHPDKIGFINTEGDGLAALGFTDRALRQFSSALIIAQHRLQQEPGRADYRLDLAISLSRFQDTARLQRALDILNSMQAANQLTPKDQPILRFAEQQLQ